MGIIKRENIRAIAQNSPLYPKEWSTIPDAPTTLYAIGNVELLAKRKFTVVGSRRTPPAALKLGADIAKAVAAHFVIVTGSADGGDMAAIQGGLINGNLICLLPGGFSAISQSAKTVLEEVAKRGLLLSPHEYDTPVRSFSYEYRNKLLAALGEGTLVLGAAHKSGALITAKYAQTLGKALFALPYAPNASAGEGCNALIKQGAHLVENETDVLSKFGVDKAQEKPTIVLSKEEELLLGALKDMTEAHASELAQKTGIPVFKLRAVLAALEVKGLAVSLGGNRYAPI